MRLRLVDLPIYKQIERLLKVPPEFRTPKWQCDYKRLLELERSPIKDVFTKGGVNG